MLRICRRRLYLWGSDKKTFDTILSGVQGSSHHVAGSWLLDTKSSHINVASPSDNKIVLDVPSTASSDTLNRAAHAATSASVEWSRNPATRAVALDAAAGCIERNAKRLAMVESLQTGIPVTQTSRHVEVCVALMREPLTEDECCASGEGVVGVLSSQCFPISDGLAAVTRAFRRGATVVWKPSELAPLSALLVAHLLCTERRILPPGVLNVLVGRGEHIGADLALHSLVQRVEFTGRPSTLQSIAASMKKHRAAPAKLRARTGKLEVLRYEHTHDAVTDDKLKRMFSNNGCDDSRLVAVTMPRADIPVAVLKTIQLIQRVRVGHALDETTEVGPVRQAHDISHLQSYVRDAQRHGGWDLAGGAFRPVFPQGTFLMPTVLAKDLGEGAEGLVEKEILPTILKTCPRVPIVHLIGM